MHFSKVLKNFLLIFVLWVIGITVHAQSAPQKNAGWPKQAIRIVVTFTPGGAPDILARVLVESWQKSLGVPVLVENRHRA